MPPLALFRCDASPLIGAGHVMRCLALADALHSVGTQCWFAGTAETRATVPTLAQSHHGWIELSSPGNAKALLHAVAESALQQWDWLIVDLYDWDAAEECQCRALARRIFVIDDLVNRPHDCDLLLDQTYGREAADYDRLVPSSCQRLVGTFYALLRTEFVAARATSLAHRSSGKLERILVSMGLTDPLNATALVIKGICESGLPLTVDVALGMSAPYLNDVRRMAEECTCEITVHADTPAMAEFMTKADLAFGTAGSTSWERCCLGLPSVLVIVAENQKEVSARLAAASAAISLNRIEGLTPADISETLHGLYRVPHKLIDMAESAAAICDGRGAQRVVMQLQPELARDGKSVWLRPVVFADLDLVYQWQSEPEARRFAKNPKIPSRKEHEAWFLARLRNPNSLYNVIMHDGQPAGTLRLDRVGSELFEISIVVSNIFYRRGIALASLKLARRLVPEACLQAEVLSGNIHSETLFTRAGFSPKGYGLRFLPALKAPEYASSTN